MNWLHYLLEANLYLCVFYAGYCLFLNKETHYTLNRVYLLLSCVVSFILPVVQIGWLKHFDSATTVVIISNTAYKTAAYGAIAKPGLTMPDILIYGYLLGTVVLAIVLLIRLYQLSKLTKASKTLVGSKYKLVNIEGSNTAFSFFNYLFIGTKTPASETIIRHELVHIRQKHSADIVFLELIKIINWFNPLIYLLQISLKTIHEYIADEQTAALESDAISYSSFLVSNAYGLNGSPLAHSFFNYNLLKKRIIMLNQKRSGNLARLKYLVAVPICAGLLCASTLGFSKNYGWIDLSPKHENAILMPAAAHNPGIDTSQIAKSATTSKGFKYQETGYLINNKTDFRVIFTEKNGEHTEYYKSKATPADLAMLKNKYGYTFPKMMIYPKLPPPPPAPPVKSKKPSVVDVKLPPPPPVPPVKSKKPSVVDVKFPPPPPVPPVKSKKPSVVDVKLPPPPPPAPPKTTKNNKAKVIDVVLIPPPASPAGAEQPAPPLPPPPPRNPFDGLYKYLSKHVRYPTAARNDHVSGQVIISFNVTDGKINSVKTAKALNPQIDAEITRAVNAFDENLDLKSGVYTLTVGLGLMDSNSNWVGYAPYNNKGTIAKTSDSNGQDAAPNQVVIVGYL